MPKKNIAFNDQELEKLGVAGMILRGLTSVTGKGLKTVVKNPGKSLVGAMGAMEIGGAFNRGSNLAGTRKTVGQIQAKMRPRFNSQM